MTTKQYLGQIERLNKMIENKMVEIGQIRSMACNVTVPLDKDRVQTSGNYDKLSESVIKLVDLENETDRLVDNYVNQRKRIIEQIDHIEKKEHYLVLTYRFVQFMDFKDIFLKMGISEKTMYTYYGQALKEFEQLYGEQYLSLKYLQ